MGTCTLFTAPTMSVNWRLTKRRLRSSASLRAVLSLLLATDDRTSTECLKGTVAAYGADASGGDPDAGVSRRTIVHVAQPIRWGTDAVGGLEPMTGVDHRAREGPAACRVITPE